MLDSTMLDDVASTCWIRLAGPLQYNEAAMVQSLDLCDPDIWLGFLAEVSIVQAPVVQRLYNAIHRINRYLVDKC